jgi:uncharacterized protein YqeY
MSTSTSIEIQFGDLLKQAILGKDQRTADCIRMIKTKHMERRTAAGFKGPLDDTLWQEVIASYQKQLRKAREEYLPLGERGREPIAQIDFEVEFCARFLPAMAGDDEVRAAVRETLGRLAIKDPKQAGKAMGEILKANKGKFDPAAVKRIVGEELAGGSPQ